MIIIIGSRKFSREIKNLCKYINNKGIPCECPPFYDFDSRDGFLSEWAGKGLVYDHLFKINRARLCILYNPNGYIGINTAMEVGYIIQQNKKIISLFDSNEYCINLFIFEVINSEKEQVIFNTLKKYLH